MVHIQFATMWGECLHLKLEGFIFLNLRKISHTNCFNSAGLYTYILAVFKKKISKVIVGVS